MKLNNKGYFLNITIIVIIVVSFIVTGCLAIVMANWNMKKTEREIQKNYYSTEMAMNDIRAGVEEGCSEDIENAYSVLISSLNTVPYDTLNKEFKEIYVNGLKGRYETGLKDTLTSYLDSLKTGIEIVSEPSLDIVLDSNKVYLRNIGVSHVSENGVYLSRIFTDIEISIPQLYDGVEVSSTSAVSFTDFALIADIKLQTDKDMTVTGGIYAGSDGIILGNSENTKCNITSQRVITRGDIILGKGSTLNLVGVNDGNSDVFANNFIVKRENTTYSDDAIAAKLKANMFILGDTLLNAKNGSFSLEGNYYGYSTGTQPNTSPTPPSAFCINGRNVNADLSNVKTLWIAGNSYIEFSDSNSSNSSDVLMGESLTYKGTQSMYLMPSVCIRNKTTGDSMSNPLLSSDIDTSTFDIVLEENQKNGGIDLTKYVDKANPYKAVHVRDSSGNGNKVYLYLNFSSSAIASKYAESFANLNEEYMDKRASSFNLGNIAFGENTSLRTTGNVVSYKDNKVTVTTGSLSSSNDYASYKEEYFKNKYNSLVSTLQEHKTSVQNASLFNYLINREELDGKSDSKYNSDVVNSGIFTCDKVVYYNSAENDYKVLIADGDVGIKSNFKGIVVTTGNISINFGVDIKGTLISGGNIYVNGGRSTFNVLDGDDSPIMYLLYDWSNRNDIRKYFNGFTLKEDSIIDNFTVKSTIKYRNWVKE